MMVTELAARVLQNAQAYLSETSPYCLGYRIETVDTPP
jgi:hypothetical protein